MTSLSITPQANSIPKLSGMEDCEPGSQHRLPIQRTKDIDGEYLGFDKLLDLMMEENRLLLQERIKRLSDRELICLAWYTGAQSNVELVRCTQYSQERAKLRKDTVLRHSFLHFTTWIMEKHGFDWKSNKKLKKGEALEQFITTVYEVRNKRALDYFARCMDKGFSAKGIKVIKRACPSLIDSYFEYFGRDYLLEKINDFESAMRNVVKKFETNERQFTRLRNPPERPTNPLSVIQTIRTVCALRINLCREEEFLTICQLSS